MKKQALSKSSTRYFSSSKAQDMTKSHAVFENLIVLNDGSSYRRQLFPNEDRAHFHKVIEIGRCVCGCGKSEVNGRISDFNAGDYILIFPFQTHYNIPDNDDTCMIEWSFIDPVTLSVKLGNKSRTLSSLIEEISIFGVIKSDTPLEYQVVAKLFDSISTQTSRHQKERLYSILCLSLIELSELSDSTDTVKLPQKFNLISRALDFLNGSIEKGELPSAEQLAATVDMPPSSFRRLFGIVMATSPKKYITYCAIKYACYLLLTTDKSISEIAASVGFYEISTFGRAFRSVIGISPKEYRVSGSV